MSLCDLKQVGIELSKFKESDQYVSNNWQLVSSKINEILLGNLAVMQRLHPSATIQGPLTYPGFDNAIIFNVGKITFMYSDNQSHPGVMCPKNYSQLLNLLKIDIASFTLFYTFPESINSVDDQNIILKSGQQFSTQNYLRDNGETVTLDIQQFELDLGNSSVETNPPIYRSLSTENVTFRGFR